MNPADDEVLHVAAGLHRLMGDYTLYLNIVRSFRQRYRGAAAEAGAALAAGDRDGALAIVHTLKGAAGMIGAQQVVRLAAALEASGGDAPLAPLAQAMERLLEETGALLAAEAPREVPPAPARPVPGARALVRQLARLLDDGDGAAIDVLEQSATALAAGLGVAVFEQVTAAAHQFDFETALARLRDGAP